MRRRATARDTRLYINKADHFEVHSLLLVQCSHIIVAVESRQLHHIAGAGLRPDALDGVKSRSMSVTVGSHKPSDMPLETQAFCTWIMDVHDICKVELSTWW